MKKIIYLLLLLNILFTLDAYAIDGKIITTIDYSINEKWNKTMGKSIPIISSVNEVFSEQYFIIAIMFTDYNVDKSNQANISYDISIQDPNNKIYYSNTNITAIKTKVVNTKYILISKANLKVNFENDKPLGEYIINITINDLISKKRKALSKSINVIKYKHANFFKTDAEFSKWFNDYYIDPSPEKAIDGYLYFSKSKLNEKESNFAHMFTFFLYIFNNNKYLIPQIQNLYNKQDLKTKIYLVYLLRYADFDSKSFLQNLDGKGKTVYNGIINKPYGKNPYNKIVDGGQLDMLWGEFYATGSFKPINKIISTLEYKKFEGSLKEYKKLSKPTEKDKGKAIYDSIYTAATWSLKSNCNHHKLVEKYCSYTLNNKKISKNIKISLENILSK